MFMGQEDCEKKGRRYGQVQHAYMGLASNKPRMTNRATSASPFYTSIAGKSQENIWWLRQSTLTKHGVMNGCFGTEQKDAKVDELTLQGRRCGGKGISCLLPSIQGDIVQTIQRDEEFAHDLILVSVLVPWLIGKAGNF